MRTANARPYRKHMLDQCWADVKTVVQHLTSRARTLGFARQVCVWERVMFGDPVEASG